jgi:hypothetical protein
MMLGSRIKRNYEPPWPFDPEDPHKYDTERRLQMNDEDRDQPEMSWDDLHNVVVNPNIARELHDQAVRLLEDVLSTKEQFQSTALVLMCVYLPIAAYLLGFQAQSVGLFIAGLFFAAGVLCFSLVLSPAMYGSLGTSPDVWLREDIVSGDDQKLAKMLAYVGVFISGRLKVSVAANRRKSSQLKLGMLAGVLALIATAGTIT